MEDTQLCARERVVVTVEGEIIEAGRGRGMEGGIPMITTIVVRVK
jgi:hypothetical protein